ncbi:ribosomal protein S18-alanine N-acetyltransferase [Desulfurococcaceae archaeon MEX13E-LK6-19]|nr:ribosomal protein S18-alanine N-acetyltransferase [Desulfurococcaceae archaeon MEX13E-LK6-19]
MPCVEEIFREAENILKEKAGGYVIRRAKHDDLPKVMHINRVCLPENYPMYFFEDLLKHYEKTFYVAESPNGDIVGYIMCRVEWKPGFFAKTILKSLHVVSIAVLADHRRKGLGYALMAYAMFSGHKEYECRETYLEVRVSNLPAIKLYEKLGYKVVKIASAYYLDGEDAYIMARPLP